MTVHQYTIGGPASRLTSESPLGPAPFGAIVPVVLDLVRVVNSQGRKREASLWPARTGQETRPQSPPAVRRAGPAEPFVVYRPQHLHVMSLEVHI